MIDLRSRSGIDGTVVQLDGTAPHQEWDGREYQRLHFGVPQGAEGGHLYAPYGHALSATISGAFLLMAVVDNRTQRIASIIAKVRSYPAIVVARIERTCKHLTWHGRRYTHFDLSTALGEASYDLHLYLPVGTPKDPIMDAGRGEWIVFEMLR